MMYAPSSQKVTATVPTVKKHTKRILKLKKGSEWFQHEEDRSVCMSSDLFLH